jgi:hypothetical protein
VASGPSPCAPTCCEQRALSGYDAIRPGPALVPPPVDPVPANQIMSAGSGPLTRFPLRSILRFRHGPPSVGWATPSRTIHLRPGEGKVLSAALWLPWRIGTQADARSHSCG